MIGGEHDHGVVGATGLVEPVKELPKMIIDLFDQTHIGTQHLVSNLGVREAAADVHCQKGGIDLVRVFELGL